MCCLELKRTVHMCNHNMVLYGGVTKMFSKLVKHYKKRLSAVILSRGDLTNILIVVPIILQCFAERKRKKDQFGVLFLQFISSTICRFLPTAYY